MHEMKHGRRHGAPAEYRVHEQEDHELARATRPVVKPALASKRQLRVLDDLIAKVERLAKRKQPTDQQPICLSRSGKKQHHASARPSLLTGKGRTGEGCAISP